MKTKQKIYNLGLFLKKYDTLIITKVYEGGINMPEKKETVVEKEEKINASEKKRKNETVELEEKNTHKIDFKKLQKKSEFKTLEVCILVLLTCIISLLIGAAIGRKFIKTNNIESVSKVDPEIQEFIKNYNYLIENYYGEVDEEELLNTAFKSIVNSLDDSYSGSLDENSSNNFDIELRGSYEGIGISIINDAQYNILLYEIIPNSPASRVDLQAGDMIVNVNGTPISRMTTSDFINNVVNKKEITNFTIVIDRNGEKKTVQLKKDFITIESVSSKMFLENGKKIGYLKVDVFASNTYEQFKKALRDLEYQAMDSLIIDLRENSGGHLTTVKDMIAIFLDSSHVIYQTEDKKGTTKIYSAGKETKKYPVVVLGNHNSASASEMMIAALVEEYDAIFIGNRTFGKGTVQELHALSNGDEYKFTTKKWLTPSGVWIHNEGIKPTIDISLEQKYYQNPTEENDDQLQAALDYLRVLK